MRRSVPIDEVVLGMFVLADVSVDNRGSEVRYFLEPREAGFDGQHAGRACGTASIRRLPPPVACPSATTHTCPPCAPSA